ncbi:MAG: hypothetical protein R3346_04585 [Candidatus Spechtbacterales bacterium]|nr:hypothetical protein [Candidatus Spechtbacterales bacterium]
MGKFKVSVEEHDDPSVFRTYHTDQEFPKPSAGISPIVPVGLCSPDHPHLKEIENIPGILVVYSPRPYAVEVLLDDGPFFSLEEIDKQVIALLEKHFGMPAEVVEPYTIDS